MNMLTKSGDNANILIHYLRNSKICEVSRLISNDLEPAVIRLAPNLLNLKNCLKSLNIQGVMVSGSGPSVFGLTHSQGEAQKLKAQLKKRYKQVFAVRTL